MQQEIHLFIDNKEVFFSEPPSILFTFQRTDYTNPSIIKNNFTKTITIEGTPENNKVFGEIWKLDRTQGKNIFNPSKRVPFELFNNGNILETGYAKLDNITIEGHKLGYEITLYGGLGDFFYGLSYGFDYDKVDDTVEQSKDEELKLKDLVYIGNVIDDKTELNFQISKDAIYNAWYNLANPSSEKNIWNVINFAPAYNGLPDNFDADKVLINTNNYTGGIRLSVPAGSRVDGVIYNEDTVIELNNFPNTIISGGETFNTINGYALSELREPLTEWEIRDLRSYLQRPVLSVKALFEAIQRYAKVEGGYDLILDEDFFSEDNPYYSKAWITLPMLQNLDGEYAEEEIGGVLSVMTLHKDEELPIVKKNLLWHTSKKYVYDIVGMPTGNGIKSASLTSEFVINSTSQFSAAEAVTSRYDGEGFYYDSDYALYMIAYDAQGNEIAQSNQIVLASRFDNGALRGKYEDTTNVGRFYHIGSNNYVWRNEGDTENTLFQFNIENEDANIDRIKLVVERRISMTDTAKSRLSNVYDMVFSPGVSLFMITANDFRFTNYASNVILKSDNDTMKSYQLVTKSKLLGQEGTPAKYMIDYCKLYNLFFDKDPVSKVVTIRTRHNFYDDKVIDLNSKIDRTKNINVKPIAFENKWYEFNFTDEEKSEMADKYYRKWSTDYGKKKINTGYNFDNSSKDLLEGNIYANAVEVLEQSKYFKASKKNNFVLPNFLQEWSNLKLFHISPDDSGVNTTDNFNVGIPSGTVSTNYNSAGARYDGIPKLQFHSTDNSPIDGSNVLMFFNGMKFTNSLGTFLQYTITDDLPAMIELNDGETCWLYTNSTTDINGNVIARVFTNNGIPVIPDFGRNIIIDNTNIVNTFDFGKANELFIPNKRYLSVAIPTIYDRFWSSYIADLYDVTTRVVQVYVKLDGKVEGDWLKHFYYFDNSIWCLTKIEDYNITSFGTTKCEFVKVTDIENYRKWYNWEIPYSNVRLWLEPEGSAQYKEVYKFKIDTPVSEDIQIEVLYSKGKVQGVCGAIIRAGELSSDEIMLTAQDFDGNAGDDAELLNITFTDKYGTTVVNGFIGEDDKWVYLDKQSFTEFVISLNDLDNSFGINSISSWGKPR